MKRAFDLTVLVLTLPVSLPLLVLTALSVLLVLGRPVLFRQRRAGLGGHPFMLFKFRSMREGEGTDAERLGRFGRFLRATSLDELPEFWNILKGEMSLVGPRPLPIVYLSRYTPEQNRRHEVLPGLTGWAQVHGRNALDWETKFRYDVAYVDHHGFLVDMRIIALTVLQLLRPAQISHAGEATMSAFVRGDTEI